MAQVSGSCLALLLLLPISGCVDESQYLEVAGGGFIFNYRNATAIYGVTLVPRRDPPTGAVIEASFENPTGSEPILLSRPARGGGRIVLQTPPLNGVQKERPYHVVVLLKSPSGEELMRIERDFVSDLDQSILPEKPLAIGPGYQRNIDRSSEPFPLPSIKHRTLSPPTKFRPALHFGMDFPGCRDQIQTSAESPAHPVNAARKAWPDTG